MKQKMNGALLTAALRYWRTWINVYGWRLRPIN